MPRVFLTCGDAVLSETLRDKFLAEGNFEICVEQKHGIDAIMEAIELFPDLVILGTETPPIANFEVAEALKLSVPGVQVFLVTEQEIAPRLVESSGSRLSARYATCSC